MARILFFLILYAFLFATKSRAQSYVFRNYSVAQGLASSTVYSVFQDSRGFMWFATENGVNRFNGRSFELFTIDNGLSDNEVLGIHEDSKGRIWFLTLNGKLSYFYNNKFYNPGNEPLLKKIISQGSFVSFFEDSRGNLWFTTNRNLLIQITASHNYRLHKSAKYSLANCFIFENEKRQLLFLNSNYCLLKVGQTFVSVPFALKPFNNKTITRTPNAGPAFIANGSLLNYNNGSFFQVKSLPEKIVNRSLGSFIVDSGNVWLSTMGSGVFLISRESKTKNFLKGNIITDLKKDADNNIWISTIGNGVFMLPSFAQSTKYYSTADGLTTNAVHSLIKTNDKLVLGLRNGSVNIISGTGIAKKTIGSAEYNPIKKLSADRKRNVIWFASDKQFGQLNFKGEVVRLLKEENNSSFAVKGYTISKSGKIALALASGVYIINNADFSLSFSAKSRLGDNNQHLHYRAFAVFYDSKENLWFSNTEGLHCLQKNGKVLHLYEKADRLSKRITDIAELPDGSIICATHGFGVYVLQNNLLKEVINTTHGLVSNICKKIVLDKSTAWVVTGKGISKIDFQNGRTVTSFSTEHGLVSSEVNDLFVKDDTIYAATNNGLSVFNYRNQLEKQAPPELYLNSLKANNEIVQPSSEAIIPHSANNITLNYIGLDYAHPNAVTYSYRLNPDLEWKETANTTLELAALEPGAYKLQLRARSMNSDWSNPITVKFAINPPFWKKWWFRTLILFALAYCLFYLISRHYRNKRLKEREELQARTRIVSLEQQALQAMMNPHFVFNVMNSIQYFINTKDNAMANQVLTGFARLIRKNLENCNKSYITIEEEVSYLTLYLSLEKLRFGDRMQYSIEVDTALDRNEVYIPSMLLQPFVENAIWHGLMPKDSEGNIWIKIKKVSDAVLHIEIIDDGIGIENSVRQYSTEHVSRGMELTNERIKLLSKFSERPITITVLPVHPEGTHIHITIPIQDRLLS
ncbi:sensor histidine kinase [Pedobacter sp. SYSU D00535]|uniref:ligand-binding sensor domain-containing protein n=1 Tax=Pedobacter sp. SYSU D00535 TaxID=2810308 RepID=UPI001A9734EE